MSKRFDQKTEAVIEELIDRPLVAFFVSIVTDGQAYFNYQRSGGALATTGLMSYACHILRNGPQKGQQKSPKQSHSVTLDVKDVCISALKETEHRVVISNDMLDAQAYALLRLEYLKSLPHPWVYCSIDVDPVDGQKRIVTYERSGSINDCILALNLGMNVILMTKQFCRDEEGRAPEAATELVEMTQSLPTLMAKDTHMFLGALERLQYLQCRLLDKLDSSIEA